jgi:hypothetical protein
VWILIAGFDCSRIAHRFRRNRSRAAFRSMPMPSLKDIASAIALWFAAGCVPISSNLRISSFRDALAGVSGQSEAMFSRRT